MIAKMLPSGPGFGAIVRYLVDEGRELLAWTSDNVLSLASAAVEMEAVAMMNPYLHGETERAMMHFTIAWPVGERPNTDTILDVARGAARRLGFGPDHQMLVVIHNDSPAGHYHAHIVVNRVNSKTYRLHNPHLSNVTLDRYLREPEIEPGLRHSAGLHAVVDVPGGKEIVRRRLPPRFSGAAHDGALQSGLTHYGSWIAAVAGEAIAELTADPDWTTRELRRVLRRFKSELVPYKSGFVIRDVDDPHARAGARAVFPALTAKAIRARDDDDPPDEAVAAPERSYRLEVREFAPDALRDEYERLRRSWLASDQGQAAKREREEVRLWRRRERERLRREEQRALKQVKNDPSPTALIKLAFDLKRHDLERRIEERRYELSRIEARLGKPATTFFKWKRERTRDTSDANLSRIIFGTGTAEVPRWIGSLERRPGPTGTDFIRDGLRVATLRDNALVLTSKEAVDVEAVLQIARESLTGPLRASGDAPFIARVHAASAQPRRPTRSR